VVFLAIGQMDSVPAKEGAILFLPDYHVRRNVWLCMTGVLRCPAARVLAYRQQRGHYLLAPSTHTRMEAPSARTITNTVTGLLYGYTGDAYRCPAMPLRYHGVPILMDVHTICRCRYRWCHPALPRQHHYAFAIPVFHSGYAYGMRAANAAIALL